MGIRFCWLKPLWMGPVLGGTCYRAAGWQALGLTRGFAKRGRGYVEHGRPKQVFVRALYPQARHFLLSPLLAPLPSSRKEKRLMVDVNRLPLDGEGGLIEVLRTIVDPRKARGVRHPVVTVVAIAVCAAPSGARGFNAMAEWAQDLPRNTLRRLGSKRWTPPSEPTLRRVLQSLDADLLDAILGPWFLKHGKLTGQGLSVDGKTLRRAHDTGQKAPHPLSAILHQEGLVVAQREVVEKTGLPQNLWANLAWLRRPVFSLSRALRGARPVRPYGQSSLFTP